MKAAMTSALLLKGFNGGLGGVQGNGAIGRPWSWVCEDAELAGAVGETLRTMGVVAPEGVGVAEKDENDIADEGWNGFIEKLNAHAGVGT